MDGSARRGFDKSAATPSQVSQLSESSTDIVSSAERRQYNKALKAMYEIVRLGAKRLDVSSASKKDNAIGTTESSEDTLNGGDISESEDGHRRSHRRPKSRKSLSFDEEESSRTLRDNEIQKVYAELMTINKRLQRENLVLQEKEQRLRDRERALREAEQLSETTDIVIDKIVDREVQKKCEEVAQNYEDQIFELEEEIKKQKTEVRRLKDSFNTIKTANDALKKQLSDIQDQNRVLEAQSISVQHRLANLQRKQEFTSKQANEKAVLQQERSKSALKSSQKTDAKTVSFALNKFNISGTLDVLSVLLEWIAESHLRKPPTFNETLDCDHEQQTLDFCSALVHEKCLKPCIQDGFEKGSFSSLWFCGGRKIRKPEKCLQVRGCQVKESNLDPQEVDVLLILPPMADILAYLPSVNPRVQECCLQFTYWCIMYMEKSVSGSQRSTLASTSRHIGEELHKPQMIKITDEGLVTGPVKGDKGKGGNIYFYSPNVHIRMLSSLIILKTLSQVDHLAHVFDVLKNDLRDDTGKQFFLTYEGTCVILPFMKPSQKALLASAVDIMLLMSMDSPFLQAFLDSCCTEPWFRSCVNLLQQKSIDEKLIEKLSIVLQRLSKSKSNRRYFEAFNIPSIVQERLRTCDPDNAFLALNLRSILFNLSAGKT